MTSGAMAPQKWTSDPGSMSNWETRKEQSSITVRKPRSWCWTNLNSDWKLTRGLVLGHAGSGPGSAWQRRRKLRRNPRKMGL